MGLGRQLITVDLGQLGIHHEGEPSQQEWVRVSREVEHALTHLGCVYLTNHGIPDHLMNKIISSAIKFFNQDKETKMHWAGETNLSGYIPSDSESFYSTDVHETHESFLFKPPVHFAPGEDAPGFVKDAAPWCKLLHALSLRMMTVASLIVGKERDYFSNMHRDIGTEEGISICRLNYYPDNSHQGNSTTGFGAHIDYTIFTFLFSNDTKGLQVHDPAEGWIDAPFMPGSLLLLAGEFLHFYSNKRLRPVLHRVILPSGEQQQQQQQQEVKEEEEGGPTSRCSLMYFIHGDAEVPMWPVSGGTAAPDPAPPSVKEYLENLILSAKK